MELTQHDYDERVARVAAGTGTDDDLRLIKHYEANGFSAKSGPAEKDGSTERVVRPDDDTTAPVKPTKATARGVSGFKPKD